MSNLTKTKTVKFLALLIVLFTQILIGQKRATFDELQIVDQHFYRNLDSLIKFEKKCLDSNFKDLHWKFSIVANNTYEFTATRSFSNEYYGFTIIDNSIVLIKAERQNLFLKTGKVKNFEIENTKPYPEDYSVWLFAVVNDKIGIVKSYTLPCD